MRVLRLSVVVAAVIGAVVANAGAAVARAEQGGVRITGAWAWFADPAQCVGGSCPAVFVSAMSGSLGFAADQTRYPGLVIVATASATLLDGELTPTSEPEVVGCADDVDVRISRDLARGVVDTGGTVALSDLTESGECTAPNGHYLQLTAGWTGSGDVTSSTRRTQYATPWQHELSSYVDASRPASVEGGLAVDGAALPAWPASGVLMRETSHDTTVVHPRPVGTAPRLPMQVTPNSVLNEHAQANAGDWTLDALQWSRGGVVLKTALALSGIVGDTFVWSGEPTSVSVSVADDLSRATVAAALPLFSDAGAVGTVSVTATLTGAGDAWRWLDHVVSGDSSSGHGEAVQHGAQREATASLTVTGAVSFAGAGDGLLAESVTKTSATQNG